MKLLQTTFAGGLAIGFVALQAVATPTQVANRACVATNDTPILFTLSFNLANSLIQVTPSMRHGLFRVSDMVTIATSNSTPIRIVSLCGEELYSGAPGDFQFPNGHYFVETDGDRTQFAVLPNDYAGASFLGTGAKNGGGTAFDISNAEIVDQTHSAWARYFGGNNWVNTEPQRGVWNWEFSDAFVAANPGRRIIYNCGFVRPAWVSRAEFNQEFAEYVGAVAARYNGQIYGIEIWNEPTGDSDFLTSPTSDWNVISQSYAQLLQAGYVAVRAVSSSIKIVGPAWYEGGFVAETSLIAQLGGNLWLDALSSHDYMMRAMAPDFTGNYSVDSAHEVSNIDSQCTDYETALPGKPLLIDEIGLYGHSALGINWTNSVDPFYLTSFDWKLGMNRAIKYVVMYRAGGADALILHAFAQNAVYPEGNLEIYGWDLGPRVGTSRGPHPKTSAFLMAGYWLNNATFLGRQTTTSNQSVYAWGYPDGSSIAFAWCREGYSTSFQNDPGLPVTDVFGQTISGTEFDDKPILFHVPASVPQGNALGAVMTAIQPSQPDYPNLSVPALGGPTSASTGDTIQIIESVFEIPGPDAGPFSVGIYLWSQKTGYILIGTRALAGLMNGETSLATNSITLPANLVTGTYAYLSVADYLNQLRKITGSANSRWSGNPMVITGFPATTTLALVPMSNQTVVAGQTLTVTVVAASSSTNILDYSVAPLPTGATMDPTYGVFTWTPSLSQVGTRGVSFSVTDGKYKASKSVDITVKKPNTPPVLKSIKPKRVRAGRRIRVALKAKDRDRDPLTYSISPLPSGATFDPLKRRLEWIPTVDQVGEYNLNVSVTDGYAISSQTLTITVY